MKLFYADAIEHSSAWGLHKDGTSRQKKKILTSTMTLNTGQQLPLGFCHVARETSDTISSTFRKDLEEIEQVRNMDENHKRDKGFLQEALEKLTYFMSDRAANEQKANELLNSWRQQMLQDSDNEVDTNTVHSFYCMAHTLLGFQYYILQEFKAQQKQYDEEEIKLGRETLLVYNRYAKEFAPLRCI